MIMVTNVRLSVWRLGEHISTNWEHIPLAGALYFGSSLKAPLLIVLNSTHSYSD